MLIAILLLALGLLGYAWAGYPLLVGLFGRRAARPASPPLPAHAALDVTAVLSAFNEAPVITTRLANLLDAAAALPAGSRYEIRLGIDGATDRTAELARAVAGHHPQVQVHDFRERRGKVTVLKELVAAARRPNASSASERLLLFTDANTRFRPGALAGLLAPFADARVGGVCGRLVFAAPQDAAGTVGIARQLGEPGAESPESAYWDLETWLKRKESALDSCLGANGAIYAVREQLFWNEIPANTIVDDLVIGMKVREQGYRMVYEPAAVAVEEFPDLASEWTRRVRIGAGDFQAVVLCRRCLSPRYGRFAWMFWSHKLLRWLTPHLSLIAVAAAALVLITGGRPGAAGTGAGSWLAQLTLLGVAAAVLAAGAGRLVRGLARPAARPFQLVEHFLMMQAALFVGFLRFCRGNLAGHWTRTPRQ